MRSGAESKNAPQAASSLNLTNVHLLGVRAGVHQTDRRLNGKSGFGPLTNRPTNQPVGVMAATPLLFGHCLVRPRGAALLTQHGHHGTKPAPAGWAETRAWAVSLVLQKATRASAPPARLQRRRWCECPFGGKLEESEERTLGKKNLSQSLPAKRLRAS